MIRLRLGGQESVLSLEEFERATRHGDIPPDAEVNLAALTGDAFVRASSLPFYGASLDPRAQLFRAHFRLSRVPLLTMALMTIFIIAYAITLRVGDSAITREALVLLGAKVGARIVDDGQSWRLLTANLLHHDLRHLCFNGVAWLCVCGALESLYRRGDLVLLWLVSGATAMITSTIANPSATVGASGVIFGALGCAVVFGIRYADVLSRGYRIYFGGVLVGYTAVMFGMGLLSSSTDNWGHAGGLAAGSAMGMLLHPRLLRLQRAAEPTRHSRQPWVLSAATIMIIVGVGPLLPRFARHWEPARFPTHGIVLWRPSTWGAQAAALQPTAFGNGSDAVVSLSCGARDPNLPSLRDAVRRFSEGELQGLVRSGNITQLTINHHAPAAVAGLPAQQLSFSFLGSDGRFAARATVFVRAEMECVLATAARDDATNATHALLSEMEHRLSLEEPKSLLLARRHAELHMDDVVAAAELALAMADGGDPEQAREQLTRMAATTAPPLRDRLLLRLEQMERRERLSAAALLR
jgi:rhomboid protease GluP